MYITHTLQSSHLNLPPELQTHIELPTLFKCLSKCPHANLIPLLIPGLLSHLTTWKLIQLAVQAQNLGVVPNRSPFLLALF